MLNCSESPDLGVLCVSATDEECHKTEWSLFPSCSHLGESFLAVFCHFMKGKMDVTR